MPTIVGGSDILQDARQTLLDDQGAEAVFGGLTGLIRPSYIGATGSSYIPTMERLTLGETQRQNTNAGRLSLGTLAEQQRGTTLGYNTNRSTLRLGTESENARQRVAQTQAQQGVLNLLAGLRGPSNAIAYNSLLNAVGRPVGQQVDPFAEFRSIYQPVNWGDIDPGEAAAPRALPSLQEADSLALPTMGAQQQQLQQQPVTQLPPQQQQPQQQGGGYMAPAQVTNRATYLPSSGASVRVDARYVEEANGIYSSYGSPQEQLAAATSPTTGAVMTPDDLANYLAVSQAAPSEAANWLRSNGFLGAAKGAEVHMKKPRYAKNGAKASGKNATVIGGEAGPEMVVGSDFEVIPISHGMDLLSPKTKMAAKGASVTDGIATLPKAYSGGSQGVSGAPQLLNNIGNPFSFETYRPEQVAALPAVQKITGGMGSRAFGGTGLDTGIPGTGTRLPFAMNLSNFSRLLPSEQQLISSVYETPRELGGLGLDFSDVMETTRRAAPVGSGGSSLTFYGG